MPSLPEMVICSTSARAAVNWVSLPVGLAGFGVVSIRKSPFGVDTMFFEIERVLFHSLVTKTLHYVIFWE